MESESVFSKLQAREAERRPIRVGVIGAGATGRAIALQLGTPVPGMRLAGIANRTPSHAERALREARIEGWATVRRPRRRKRRSAADAPYWPRTPPSSRAAGPSTSSSK